MQTKSMSERGNHSEFPRRQGAGARLPGAPKAPAAEVSNQNRRQRPAVVATRYGKSSLTPDPIRLEMVMMITIGRSQ